MRELATYARAALPLVPGASRLPFVPGGGGEMPQLERSRAGVKADPDALAAYAHLCGFVLRDRLPATYPHIAAFPLQMALMTDGRFPFPIVGLVHVRNAISVRRPLLLGESFDLHVRVTAVEPHAKGSTFALVTDARVGDEVVWTETSTMLRRGGGGSQEDRRSAPAEREENDGPLPAVAEWRLAEDLGRRYGAVSGDRNPIHLHALSARAFGFPRAIAHGMWTKARCLAALEPRLPDAYDVAVSFKRPILLPGRVTFASDGERFAVRSAKDPQTPHLEGTVTR